LEDKNQYNPGLEQLLAQFEAKSVEQEVTQVSPPEIVKEVVKEVEKQVKPIEVERKKEEKKTEPKKLVPKKIIFELSEEQRKQKEELEKQRQLEREKILEGKEEEIFVEDIEPSVIPFDDVKRLLRNRLQEPAYSRVIGDKQFMNISKQISYCVGLSA
jgi:hypothetical protein